MHAAGPVAAHSRQMHPAAGRQNREYPGDAGEAVQHQAATYAARLLLSWPGKACRRLHKWLNSPETCTEQPSSLTHDLVCSVHSHICGPLAWNACGVDDIFVHVLTPFTLLTAPRTAEHTDSKH